MGLLTILKNMSTASHLGDEKKDYNKPRFENRLKWNYKTQRHDTIKVKVRESW